MGPLQIRLVGGGEPLRLCRTGVVRFLSAPERVDVGAIGGEAGRHLGTLGDSAVAGNHDVDAPSGFVQPAECRLVGASWSS